MAGKYPKPVIWLPKATFFFGTEATGQLSRLVGFPFGCESGPVLQEGRVSFWRWLTAVVASFMGPPTAVFSRELPGTLWGSPGDTVHGDHFPQPGPVFPLQDSLFEPLELPLCLFFFFSTVQPASEPAAHGRGPTMVPGQGALAWGTMRDPGHWPAINPSPCVRTSSFKTLDSRIVSQPLTKPWL